MTVASPLFILFAIIMLIIWHRVRRASNETKFVFINLIFVATFFNSPESSLAIAVFSLLGYISVRLCSVGVPTWILCFNILIIILVFVVFKKYTVFEKYSPFGFDTSTIGLSYILFRVIHLIVDVHQGSIKESPSFKEYINYLFFFLSFESGPITRYQEYREQMELSVSLSAQGKIEHKAAFARIIIGLIKVLVVATIANRVAIGLPLELELLQERSLGVFGALPTWAQHLFPVSESGQPLVRTTIRYSFRALAFLFYLYYNFSGYMDIVCGVGRLFGYAVSENFQQPFSSSNFIEFWSRWHITLSNWFKTYVFNPILKGMVGLFGTNAANFSAIIAFFVTFLIMGVWHGTTTAFIVYGLFLGFGVSLNRLYQVAVSEFIGKKRYGVISSNPFYKCTAQAMFIAYFVISLSCLWLSGTELLKLAHLFGISGMLFVYVMLVIAIAVSLTIWNALINFLGSRVIGIRSAAMIGGLSFICLLWGNVNDFANALTFATGIGVPESMISVLGGLVIIFAINCGEGIRHPKVRIPSLYIQPIWVAFLMIASIMSTGTVPDFVYKGF